MDLCCIVRDFISLQGNFFLLGDVTVLLRAVSAYESQDSTSEFCVSVGIRHKAMSEIVKLRQQLVNKGLLVLLRVFRSDRHISQRWIGKLYFIIER